MCPTRGFAAFPRSRRPGIIGVADRRRQPGPHPGPARVTHPGPVRAALPDAIRDALIVHARAEHPNEACGLIAGTAPPADGGTATRWFATRNRAASPLRYEVHPDDLLRASLEIDDADEVTWGIVHSHVRSPARPSPTDVGLAFYPDALYVLVSLAADQADPATGAESVRAWRIVDGVVFEVALDAG
jgi:proteasome lid subunit RPN8/RPN11